jgi:hypothetical protein
MRSGRRSQLPPLELFPCIVTQESFQKEANHDGGNRPIVGSILGSLLKNSRIRLRCCGFQVSRFEF